MQAGAVTMHLLSVSIGYENEPMVPRTSPKKDAVGIIVALTLGLWAAWLLWAQQ